MKISINGSIIDESEAVVSVYDHGFLYGMGVFETFRTYDGIPFLLDQHLQRLASGCKELGIQFQPDAFHLQRLIRQLLSENGLSDGYFRYTITAGMEALGLPGEHYEHPLEVLYVKELPKGHTTKADLNTGAGTSAGKSLQILRHRRNTPEGQIRLKSLHYMNNILAKRELLAYPWAGGAEGLMLTEDGWVAEGIVSNVFFVHEERLYTPSLDTGILPGITRELVITQARRLGLSVEEGKYTLEQLQSADEIFITNSIQELVPVQQLWLTDGTALPVGVPGVSCSGKITAMLIEQYQRCIGSGL